MIHFTDLLQAKLSDTLLSSSHYESSIRSGSLPGHLKPEDHCELRSLKHPEPPRLAHLLPLSSEAVDLVGAAVKISLAIRLAARAASALFTTVAWIVPLACAASSLAAANAMLAST